MARPQFSIRFLLVFTLLAGLAVWGYIQKRRSAHRGSFADEAQETAENFRALATHYATDADRGWALRPDGTHLTLSQSDRATEKQWAKDCLALAEHCDGLSAKYRGAARAPWLSIEPDDPPPQPVAADHVTNYVPHFKP